MNKVKRVLHLPYSLSRGSGIMGIIMNMYRNINRNRIQFDFLCFKKVEDSYEDEISAMGGGIYYIDEPRLRTLLRYKKEVDVFFKQYAKQYVAVHYHAISIAAYCLTSARKYGVSNCISHSHATMYGDKKISAIRNYIISLPLKRQANIYFACSKAAGEVLYGNKLMKQEKVRILNNAVDTDKFQYNSNVRVEYREKFGWDNKFVVGHVGRFNEQKNHDLLIDIFYELKKKKIESILVLVGEGPLKSKIEEKVKDLGLIEDVIFLGARSDVAQLLQGMDIFVLPSFFEGLPVSGIEAQAAGLPCVMSDSITKEVALIDVDFLSVSCDAKEWAEKILKYSLYERVDTKATLKDLSFDIKNEAQKLEEYYMEL